MKTYIAQFNQDLSLAPYDTPLLLLFEDSIHSGVKTSQEWIKYPGLRNEERGVADSYDPISIGATYSSEPYFYSSPIGWALLSNVINNHER